MAPELRFVLCGSVDDGKSTLIGRILSDCGHASAEHEPELRRHQK